MKRKRAGIGEEGSEKKQKKTGLSFFQERLDENAKEVGYGYKTANLMEFKNVVDNLSGKLPQGYQVAVPNFVGITSEQIQDFFNKNGLDIQARWNQIIPSMDIDDSIQYLKDPNNRKIFIDNSEKLANEIENLEIPEQSPDFQAVASFLSKAQQNNWRLMVRSTGKEDTKELPNAGGNHSEPNVYPDKVAVINAIKKVVASYFKEKSLSQRIDAGDKDIFADPLTPVLIQQMIGEPIGETQNLQDIPVGCVVYTGEVEGSTPGVITIQAAFGHNEGVVNSEVAVDTYYVKDGSIRPVIQIKNQRIIPVESNDGYGLELVNNPEEIKNVQVLSDEDILVISQVARAIHEYYNEAMDIELVFEPSTKTVYLVQARPLQIKNEVEASYISDIKTISQENVLKCSTVSAAGGSVRHITNKNQIIIASTLQQALDKYLSGGVDQSQVLAVIVQGQAEPTSHAAAIFRGAGKAILTSDGIEKLEKWLNEENINLFVDVQREIVVNTKDLVDFDGLIKIGWFKHPISQRMTITLAPYAEPEFTKLFSKNIPLKTRKELIETMKNGKNVMATRALKTLLAKISNTLEAGQEVENQSVLQARAFNELQQIYNVATKLAQEMLNQKIFEKGPQDIERLYAINFLEAILFQPKETSRSVSVFSVKSVFDDYEKSYEFIKKIRKRRLFSEDELEKIINNINELSIMQFGFEVALTDELENKWVKFVYGVFVADEAGNINNLKSVFEKIKKLEILPLWMNTIFAYAQGDVGAILQGLNKQLTESDQFLKIILNKKNWLKNFDPNKFDDPKKYEKLLSSFKENILKDFISYDFINEVKNGTLLSKEVAMEIMSNIVDAWDKSIKALKGSVQYELKDKVEKFREMLKVYFEFLKKWKGSVEYKNIFNSIDQILNKQILDYEAELINSVSFNVELTAVGRKGVFERYKPKTFEDVFTFIHQSLINIISIKTKEIFPEIQLPELVNNVIEMLKKLESVSLFYYEFKNNDLIVTYNKTIRTHSIVYQLRYNKLSSMVYLETKFYGDDEEGRWERMADFIDVASDLMEIPLSKNNAIKMTEIFEFEIDKNVNDEKLDKIFKILEQCLKISLDTDHVYLKRGVSGRIFLNNLNNIFQNKEGINSSIIKLSLDKNKINWLLPDVLKNVVKKIDFLTTKQADNLKKIKNMLSNESSEYFIKTIVFIFKILNDPRGVLSDSFFGPEYYLVNESNFLNLYYKQLTEAQKLKLGVYFFGDVLASIFLVLQLNLDLININEFQSLRFQEELLFIKYYFELADGKKINDIMGFFNKIYAEQNEELEKKALVEFYIYSISILFESSDSKAKNFGMQIIKKVFDGENEELKKVPLEPFGVVYELLKSKVYDEQDLAIKILTKVFNEGSDDLKIRVLKISGFVSHVVSSNSTAIINGILTLLQRVFSGNDESLKIKMLGKKSYVSPFYFLITSKYKPFVDKVEQIIENIFKSGSEGLKKAALNPLNTLIEYSDSQKTKLLAYYVLNEVLDNGSNELKEASLKAFNTMIKKFPVSIQEINLAEKFLNNVFVPGSEKIKKEFLGNIAIVIKLIESENKALKIAKSFFVDVIEKGSSVFKKELFKLYGPIYYLTEKKSAKVLEFVVDILTNIFEGADDELKHMVLDSYYTIPNLIKTNNEYALSAVTMIFKNIFSGENEDLKEKVKQGFGYYIKKQGIKTD
ncbi:MAG: PEP/pyruvate-binding domain-containing protein [bacterium]